MTAIFNVTPYSYFRDDLGDTDMHKCIHPLDIVYYSSSAGSIESHFATACAVDFGKNDKSTRMFGGTVYWNQIKRKGCWTSTLTMEHTCYLARGEPTILALHLKSNIHQQKQLPQVTMVKQENPTEKEEEKKVERSTGKNGRRTWEQTNNYARDWQPQTSNPDIYAAKFRDAHWLDQPKTPARSRALRKSRLEQRRLGSTSPV